jgi:quercetin dioxygenase-like cupin family protein
MNLYKKEKQRMFTTPNAVVCPLATKSLGASQLSVIRQRMQSGSKNPTHTQTHEEVMVMLSGDVQIMVGGAIESMSPGDVLTVGAGVPHSIENIGETEAEWLIISRSEMQFHGPEGKLMSPHWAQ